MKERLIKNNSMPSNSKFGYFFSVIFFTVCGYLLYIGEKEYVLIFAVLGAVFLLTALFKPNLLEQLNHIWFNLGILLGKITSPVLISIIFFALITPVAIIMRIGGRDILLLKKSKAVTYWVNRSSREDISFKDQF